MLTAIRRLPDRQREALVLRFYLDLDEEEIAASMRISRGGWTRRGRVRVGWASPGWGGWARRLTPLAAAVAVVVVVLSVVGIGRTMRSPAGRAPAATSGPGPVVAGPPISSYVSSGQVPRYYVAITSHGNPNFGPSCAVVKATVSGKTLATIKPSVAG